MKWFKRQMPTKYKLTSPLIPIAGVLWLGVVILTGPMLSLDYTYDQNGKETILVFRNESPFDITHLKSSASSYKIYIKLSGLGYIRSKELLIFWKVPPHSAVRDFRLIPYNSNLLLVIDLWDSVPYELIRDKTHLKIHLKDDRFRDPVEYEYWVGRYYQRTNRIEKALQQYRKVIARNKKHPYAFFRAGQIRLLRKEFRKAEINFNKALRFGCDSVAIYKDMALLYQSLGDIQKAEFYQAKYQYLTPSRHPVAEPGPASEEDAMQIELVDHQGHNPESVQMPAITRKTKTDSPFHLIMNAHHRRWLLILGTIFGLVLFAQAAFITLRSRRKNSKRPTPNSRLTEGAPIVPSGELSPEPTEPVEAPTGLSDIEAAATAGEGRIIQVKEKVKRLIELSRETEPPSTEAEALIETLLAHQSEASPPPEPPEEREIEPEPAIQHYRESDISADTLGFIENEKAYELAKKLRTGIGEIELALNQSLQTGKSLSNPEVRWKVLQLYDQNLTVEEIARLANIGKGEVELLLRMNRGSSRESSRQQTNASAKVELD